MMKVKEKSKQIPFNVQLPWGESIAQQMGTSLDELKTNLPNDKSIEPVVTSTCAMVRDFAVKELMARNQKAGVSLSDICYGTGYIMLDGKMTQTGGCMLKAANAKGGEEGKNINMGDGSNDFSKTCELREGDTFIKHRRFFGNITMRKETPVERLKKFNVLGEHNTTALGAADYIPPVAFLQKAQADSNTDIPPYFNSTLNGKGHSFNAKPNERYDTQTEKSKFHTTAQKEKPVAEGEGEAVAEEGEALGTTSVSIPLKNSDDIRPIIKMTIPDQVCTAICAGLDIEGLLEGNAIIEPPEEKPEKTEVQLNNPHMNTEEGLHMNTKRQGFDNNVMPDSPDAEHTEDPLGKLQGGGYVCSAAAPKISDCLERGNELSHWISERILNSEHFCDQDKGNCGVLLEAAA